MIFMETITGYKSNSSTIGKVCISIFTVVYEDCKRSLVISGQYSEECSFLVAKIVYIFWLKKC